MSIGNISNRIEQLVITKIIAILETPIEELAAYKLDLIDKQGNKIKEPKSKIEKRSLSLLTEFILKLRQHIETNKTMRDQQLTDIKRKYALKGVYPEAEKMITVTECAESYTGKELIEEMAQTDESQLYKGVEDELDKRLEKKTPSKYQLLNKNRRRRFIRQAFGLDDTFVTPTLGGNDE